MSTAAMTSTGVRMPLADHLREARTRLIRSAAAVVVAAVVGYAFSDQILDILRAPILELAESRDTSLNYDSVTGAFDLKLQIAILSGLVLSSPVWLYEVFAFVAPGLTRKERRYTFGFLFSALPLFVTGCAAGLFMFPHMIQFLTSFASTQDSTLLQASYYVDFVLNIVLSTGVAFTIPVFVVLLNFLGILPARTIARGWRACVIAIVLFSALVTPAADVLSMFLVALPMTLLFLGAYVVAYLHDRAVTHRRPDLVPATQGVA